MPEDFNGAISSENSSHFAIEEFFNDPKLIGLIDQALVGNQEVRIKNENVRIARDVEQRSPVASRHCLFAVSKCFSPCDRALTDNQFLRLRNGLVPAIGFKCRLDGLVQLLRPPGVLAGQLSQPRRRDLCFLRGD